MPTPRRELRFATCDSGEQSFLCGLSCGKRQPLHVQTISMIAALPDWTLGIGMLSGSRSAQVRSEHWGRVRAHARSRDRELDAGREGGQVRDAGESDVELDDGGDDGDLARVALRHWQRPADAVLPSKHGSQQRSDII